MRKTIKVSLAKREAHLHQKTVDNKLKPPYDCPKCSRPKSLKVKITETNYSNFDNRKVMSNKYEVTCKHGCLNDTITLPNAYTELDAYHKILDKLRHQN